jgi:excisionase family DNA binding protein
MGSPKKPPAKKSRIVQVPPLDLNRRYTVPEASIEYLRISRALAYIRIKDGHLKTVRDGGKVFITGAEIQRYLSQSSVA